MSPLPKAVLGYSGGLDTSVAIKWLKDTYNVDVVCALIDVGQPLTNLDDAIARGKANGAAEVIVVDAKDEFAQEFLVPALHANALYEDIYPLATALARPLIAKKLVEVAKEYGAAFIAHGCTGKGNDQVRFEVSIRALAPDIKVIAPLREWKMTREGEIAYANEHGILLPDIAKKSTFSTDENLWGRSVESGVLENPANEAVPEAFDWTKDPVTEAPAHPEYVTIAFEKGVPVSVDGKTLSLVELVTHMNNVAGHHGIGRIDHVENRLVGIKSREIYEAPAAVALIAAHKALEALTLTRDVSHFKTIVEDKFSELVYDGLWYAPLRSAASAFLANVNEAVTGEVTLKLFKGSIAIAGRTAPQSLYNHGLATYDKGDVFSHDSAAGFIDLFGLPLGNLAKVKGPADPRIGQ